MFGSIIKLDNNEVTIENKAGKALSNLMNYHLIFEEANRKIVGEVIYIDASIIKLLLVGEIVNNKFSSGVVRKPNITNNIRVINKEELELILGSSVLNKNDLYLGKSAIYKDFGVSVPLNSFFANHSAIIGNTGSGKSCGVARILQNLFVLNPNKPKNAHMVIFDAYGEYANTFLELNNIGLSFARYSTKRTSNGENILKLPIYFLDVDDLALLLQATSSEQIPVLAKTLKLVKIFKSNNPGIKEYKDDIIAECILDILISGKEPSTIRDQIIAVLSRYHTENLNLESMINQPGYYRTLLQCLHIDRDGKLDAMPELMDFLKQFKKVNLEDILFIDEIYYNLNDLYYALEFALISEGTINSDVAYKQMNVLKNRLQTLINSKEKMIFEPDFYLSKKEFVEEMFGENQIVNINLSYLDDHFAKVLTKLYSKLLFNHCTSLYPRAQFSVNIILEEAHRYVQNDNDINIIGYNIFDRITKEGRKYGTLLTFITQRPSELSVTALSQCANFIVFKIYQPKDLEIVLNMSANVSPETIEEIKSLTPGTAFAFGTGFKMPLLISFDLPTPMPESTSVDVSNIWY